MSLETYKLFLPLSLFGGWIGVLLPHFLSSTEKHKSVSWHAAQNRRIFLLTASAMTLSSVFLFAFIFKWLIPTYHLPWPVTACFILSALGLLIASIVPAGKGRRGRIHDNSASLAFLLFLPINLFFIFSHDASDVTRILLILTSVGMAFILRKLWFSSNETLAHHLYWECCYFALVDLGLLAITFIR